MVQPQKSQDWAWLARIRRPQGRKGEVFAEILTDYPEKFSERKQVWLLAEGPENRSNGTTVVSGPRAALITHHWLHKGGVVLHFADSLSISDAEKLSGLVVAIPLEERMALGEDEAYIGDLIQCELVDVSGPEPTVVGRITDVDRSAGPVALLIVAASHGEVMVPFAKSYLRKIDIANQRLEMALPAGLLDLNS